MGIRQRDGRWFIDYYVGKHRVREMVGTSKRQAEQVLAKRKSEVAEGRHLNIKEKKYTLQDLVDEYLRVHSITLARGGAEDRRHAQHLLQFFGPVKLSEISQRQVMNFRVKRLETVRPATVNRSLALLKAMFNRAIAWEWTERNPVKGLKMLAEENQSMRFLSKQEITTVVRRSGLLRPIIVVALSTGMREGELLGLQWAPNVNFRNRKITLYLTKSKKVRHIDMTDACHDTLMKLQKHPDHDHVFHYKGKPLKQNGFIRTSFKSLVERLKKYDNILPFRFHDLRHTFASQYLMAGGTLPELQSLLGHKDIRTTMRYSHFAPNARAHSMGTFGHALGLATDSGTGDAAGSRHDMGTEEKQSSEASVKKRRNSGNSIAL